MKSPATMKLPKLISRHDSGCLAFSLHAVTRSEKIVSRSGPACQLDDNGVLPVASAMASAHNGILRIACNAECPDLQQLLLSQKTPVL